jgi:DNA-binding CsgD family transcriptional regulator
LGDICATLSALPALLYCFFFLPMISTEELSQLLETLYAAPLQPEKWQAFFDHLSRLTKISCGYLITGSEREGQTILAGGGLSFNPEVLQLYKDYYGPMDPFWSPYLRNPRVSVIQGEELVSHDQLRKTEFYTDLLADYEMESMTMLSCSSTVEQTDVMPVWRRSQDGPMDHASIELLRTLLPHAHAALRIRTALQAVAVQSQFAELALDTMSIAVFLVTATSSVQHMNKPAAILAQGADGLRLEGTVLTANDSEESAQLALLISGAASAGSKGIHTTPGGALNISRQRAPGSLRVAVLPIPEERRSMMSLPCALVFASDPLASPKSRAAFMRMLYRLTPVESRLADLLLEGLEVRRIADRLGITIQTARFHLKRVLAKTGTRRQTELMRLMLSLPGE